MAREFKYIVIGGGMMGAAAARHLSQREEAVALIGPGEPSDYRTHHGVFASHYDEARITRRFDGDLIWATFAARAIDRYREIEEGSGIRFFSEAGCLFAGPEPRSDADYLYRAARIAETTSLTTVEKLTARDLTSRFPQFEFPGHVVGYHEPVQAGHINPRALVRAQIALAKRGGATHVEATVNSVREEGGRVRVEAGGEIFHAERVLLAAGAFSNQNDLLPRTLEMRAAPRTVVFFELHEARLATFATMPSTIVFTDREEDHVYILPPVRYPDGKTYLKLGGDIETGDLTRPDDFRAWFASAGNPQERRRLTETALQIMPGLEGCLTSSAACVATFTPTGRPYAGFTDSSRIAVLTGGNFVAAKSSDELGRLGAVLLLEGGLGEDDFGSLMTPLFR
ncbi:FAD-dependent oxidoreductase [Pseudorhizobium endolithicum]|uniref:FAD-dependent oxidoreductase n=1 Tax=Pseudorhizobium endolithicum TaxID=1191678 RepID=A0ABM8PDI3_9HYPH|nr:FAD-dependent oxidoreductase [Pseudorhizobium endolithicum]CAD7023706.1 FAD-dependent oxidoreductase [Pseudorhizobium endolithicum]